MAFVDWLNKELWRRNYHFEVTLPPTSPVPGSEFVHVEGDAIVDIRDSEANGFEKGVVAKDNTRVTVGNLRLNAGRTRASLFTLRVVER